MPTGTLANHLAVRALAGGPGRVIVQHESHLYQDNWRLCADAEQPDADAAGAGQRDVHRLPTSST